MVDPLTELINLLRPKAVFAKAISGAGSWAVRYSEFGEPSFCTVLEGSCRLAVDGEAAVSLQTGDFVLLPGTPPFLLSGFEPAEPTHLNPAETRNLPVEVRHGRLSGDPDVRLLGGYFEFDSADAALLVSLLPRVVHVSGVDRLSTLVRLIADEARAQRSGSELVLSRLVEVLLIEALRFGSGDQAPQGLLRGLADERLAAAIRGMHAEVERSWTIAELAKSAGLSRSAFFDRFMRQVGLAPMSYLLEWRMALARDLLRRDISVSEVAERVGYSSSSTFSTAFSRHVGQPPAQYARSAAR
ncbi:MAG: cupin domain-containing protein [Polyangiaceae bacterium]|nr:cupin domain-containing protein [Polyangiaceae bacterium]